MKEPITTVEGTKWGRPF